jgi:small-conductance mechanosensitive channel
MPDILNTEIYGNKVQDWLVAILVVVCVTILLYVITRFSLRRIERIADEPGLSLYDLSEVLLKRTNLLFILIVSIYISKFILHLGDTETYVLNVVALGAFFLQAGLWLDATIVFYANRYLRQESDLDPGTLLTIKAMGLLARLAMWSVTLLLILSNAGVNIGALIAGMGVVGVAVALSLQTVLKDLFASFSIMLDQPFLAGHSVEVGDYQGTVEKIGLKTTRIRSVSGEQIVFSNQDLVESRLRNYKRMETRRIPFSFMVTYQTPLGKLAAIPDMAQEIIEAQDQVRFDRAHFKEYHDFGLVFEVVYYVLTADYEVYMDIQQAVNLALFKRFHDEGIEFAYIKGQLATAKATVQEENHR